MELHGLVGDLLHVSRASLLHACPIVIASVRFPDPLVIQMVAVLERRARHSGRLGMHCGPDSLLEPLGTMPAVGHRPRADIQKGRGVPGGTDDARDGRHRHGLLPLRPGALHPPVEHPPSAPSRRSTRW